MLSMKAMQCKKRVSVDLSIEATSGLIEITVQTLFPCYTTEVQC